MGGEGENEIVEEEKMMQVSYLTGRPLAKGEDDLAERCWCSHSNTEP